MSYSMSANRPKRSRKRVDYGEPSSSDLDMPPPKRILRTRSAKQRRDGRTDSPDMDDGLDEMDEEEDETPDVVPSSRDDDDASQEEIEETSLGEKQVEEESIAVAKRPAALKPGPEGMTKTTVTYDFEWRNKYGDLLPDPLDEEIEHRKEPLVLPPLDLSIILQPESTISFTRLSIIGFIRGVRILPVLKGWANVWNGSGEECQEARKKLDAGFPPKKRPWAVKIARIAEHAAERARAGKREKKHQISGVLIDCAVSIVKVKYDGTFRLFSAYNLATNEHYKYAVRLLLTVLDDIRKNPAGFFGILLQSELAKPQRPEAREVFAACYPVDPKHYKEPAADVQSREPEPSPKPERRKGYWEVPLIEASLRDHEQEKLAARRLL